MTLSVAEGGSEEEVGDSLCILADPLPRTASQPSGWTTTGLFLHGLPDVNEPNFIVLSSRPRRSSNSHRDQASGPIKLGFFPPFLAMLAHRGER
jgi:hypothetical protein